jgi:hypothetical protein
MKVTQARARNYSDLWKEEAAQSRRPGQLLQIGLNLFPSGQDQDSPAHRTVGVRQGGIPAEVGLRPGYGKVLLARETFPFRHFKWMLLPLREFPESVRIFVETSFPFRGQICFPTPTPTNKTKHHG